VKDIGVEVAKATGVSESSVRRIIRETKNIESGASTSFPTPHKERPRKSPRRCQHVRNIEQQLMAREGLLDGGREFVFHVGSDSDDRSDDDEQGQHVEMISMQTLPVLPL
jgi:hypothetical protein